MLDIIITIFYWVLIVLAAIFAIGLIFHILGLFFEGLSVIETKLLNMGEKLGNKINKKLKI